MDEQATPQQAPSIEERIHSVLNPQEAPTERKEEPRGRKEDPPQAEEAAASQDLPADVETTDGDAAELEVEASTATDGGGEDDDAITVSSLAELMESVGAEPDSMYDLTFPVTIDGKRVDVPLSEIKDSFRATKEAQRFQEKDKAAREQAKAFSEQAQASVKQQLAQAKSLADGLDEMYLAPFRRVNWDELRTDDPAEYAAKRQEYIDTKNAVDGKKQQVLQEIQYYQQQQQSELDEVQGKMLAREREALFEKWPEMANEKTGDAERSAVVSFLKSAEFTDEEIGAVSDHRTLLLIRDAMRYRTQAKQVDAAKKKVIKIGKKVLTPGAAQSKAQAAANRTQPLRDRLRQTGSVEDAAALLSQRFQGRK